MMHSVCERCEYEHRQNPQRWFLRYYFQGHHPVHVNTQMSTWFHAECEFPTIRDPKAPDARFAHGFRVWDFLYQQSELLPFDNQVHVHKWNLVHKCSQHGYMYKIFDHHLLMNKVLPMPEISGGKCGEIACAQGLRCLFCGVFVDCPSNYSGLTRSGWTGC